MDQTEKKQTKPSPQLSLSRSQTVSWDRGHFKHSELYNICSNAGTCKGAVDLMRFMLK